MDMNDKLSASNMIIDRQYSVFRSGAYRAMQLIIKEVLKIDPSAGCVGEVTGDDGIILTIDNHEITIPKDGLVTKFRYGNKEISIKKEN